ncbi:MAG: energy transducer TonB [Pyrinomonadaceae bacterium]
MKRYFRPFAASILMSTAFAAAAIAQDDQTGREVFGGVLNGKALSLPKPVYPPAARAVRAEGTVVVQITVDETGSVISAEAVSGHPLLRPAAVESARGAKFSPTLITGPPIKVTGVLVYNFVAPKKDSQ